MGFKMRLDAAPCLFVWIRQLSISYIGDLAMVFNSLMTLKPLMIVEKMKDVIRRFTQLSLSSRRRIQIILKDLFFSWELKLDIRSLISSCILREVFPHFRYLECHAVQVIILQKCSVLYFERLVLPVNVFITYMHYAYIYI